MKLYIDIGNSRIKWLCSDDAQSSSMPCALEDFQGRLTAAWQALQSPESVFISNVADPRAGEIIYEYTRTRWHTDPVFLKVMKNFDGLINAYDDIGQMGVDRWMALVAGWSAYKDNLCIIDCGTAITVDLVLADGRHLGGYILPGTHLMQDLLNINAHGIKVKTAETTGLSPGKSTEECLRNGVHLAIAALIERTVREHEVRHGCGFRCIITGGSGGKFRDLLSLPCEYDPDLVFKGMAVVSGDGE